MVAEVPLNVTVVDIRSDSCLSKIILPTHSEGSYR